MITYFGGAFGFKVLTRLHGSAVFKSLMPALFSSIIYIILFEFIKLNEDGNEIFGHPYPMGALVSAFTFLLAFRANFAYNRYWEAFGAIHTMHSKWLDFATEVAAFHYQAERYDSRKPPAFGSYPYITNLNRQRERVEEPTKEELKSKIEEIKALEAKIQPSIRSRFRIFLGKKPKPQEKTESSTQTSSGFGRHKAGAPKGRAGLKSINKIVGPKQKGKKKRHSRDHDNEKFDEHGHPFSTFKIAARTRLRAGGLDPDHPPLFLEEAAHLLSLLSAVAMSTLRNDMEEAESPLIEFKPGMPWPHSDPDAYAADVRKDWATGGHSKLVILRYLFGLSRTDGARTLYNASRPFRVIGNISDAEIEMLQAARGPLAKVALCSMWLQEFISREYLSGSTGKVAPPIISRLYQFISDGMAAYNQARKIAYIPFPFPHAQITTLFVLVIVGFMPVLMLTYLHNEVFGFILNLLTVMCFTGLHEVARELESPFQNVPNDVPLNNFQAQYNEGIMVMFFGYHPDAYWKPEDSFVRKVELTRTSSDRQLPKAEEKKGVIGSFAEKNDEVALSARNALVHSFDDMEEERKERSRTDKGTRAFGSKAEEEVPEKQESPIAEDNKRATGSTEEESQDKLHSFVEYMLPSL